MLSCKLVITLQDDFFSSSPKRQETLRRRTRQFFLNHTTQILQLSSRFTICNNKTRANGERDVWEIFHNFVASNRLENILTNKHQHFLTTVPIVRNYLILSATDPAEREGIKQ